MPVIERPASDIIRKQSLQTAKEKYDNTPVAERAYDADTYALVDAQLDLLGTKMQARADALSAQAAAGIAANPHRRSTRLYVSHFIMSFNMAVLREEFSASDRAYYQLDISSDSVPKLTTDEDLTTWAENIIAGEAKRVLEGGEAMANPSAAQVKDQLVALTPLLATLSAKKSLYDAAQEAVAALREPIDKLIKDVWDQVLFYYRKDDAPSIRRKARPYGVTYVPSKGEVISPDEFSLKGVASDHGTSAVLADVHVEIVELTQITITDSKGRYIFGLQPPGSYTVRFSKTGYKTVDVPVTISATEVATVDVLLSWLG
jgi:hypothetical protein